MAINYTRALYYAADAAFNLIVIFPLFIAYWSGSWKILDLYTTPKGDQVFSSWLSLVVGSFIGILGYFILPCLEGTIQPSCNIKHVVVSRLFIYISAWGIIFFWRGVWDFVDRMLGDSLMASGILLGAAYLVLILMKCTVNVMGPPFAVNLDTSEHFYYPYPRFRTQLHEKPLLYTLDAIFTAIVIQGVCVLVWVGLWNVFDAVLLPKDKFTSYIVSLVAGYTSAALLFILQYPSFLLASKLYERGKLYELIYEYFVNALASVSVLLLWRGGWGMVKDFVLTERLLWLCWVIHGVGIGGLLICHVGVVLGGVGCDVDGEKGEGYDVIWPIDYFWYLCHGGSPDDEILNIQVDGDDEDDPLLVPDFQVFGPSVNTPDRHIPTATNA